MPAGAQPPWGTSPVWHPVLRPFGTREREGPGALGLRPDPTKLLSSPSWVTCCACSVVVGWARVCLLSYLLPVSTPGPT